MNERKVEFNEAKILADSYGIKYFEVDVQNYEKVAFCFEALMEDVYLQSSETDE